MKAKVGVSDAQANILAREQSKMKLLSQCVKNGQQFKNNDVPKPFGIACY